MKYSQENYSNGLFCYICKAAHNAGPHAAADATQPQYAGYGHKARQYKRKNASEHRHMNAIWNNQFSGQRFFNDVNCRVDTENGSAENDRI